jgi:two-component system response regulator NreC
MRKLRILLVDDHAVVRAGIRSLLEGEADMEVVGEARSGEEAVDKATQLQPELVLMDIAMPGMNGIEATRRIKTELPGTSVLILTMHDDEQFFFPALRAGASGYVVKEAEPRELLNAIQTVGRGHVFLSSPVAKTVFQEFVTARDGAEEESYNLLTAREKEVLQLAASGETNRQIAGALFLSTRTVEKHRQSMMRKLDLSTREQLTKYALRKGLIDFEF